MGHGISLSLVGIADTYVRKDSESVSASLSASLISFETRNSPCRVIRVGILASCANMSKQKGALSPFEGSFFNDLSNRTSFYFSLSSGGDDAKAWTSAVVPNVVGCCISLRGLVVLSQILSSRPGTYWLRGSGLHY